MITTPPKSQGDLLRPDVTVYDRGYNKNLVKDDPFYDDASVTQSKVTDPVNVNNITGDTGVLLPDQSTHTGEFLTTDGSTASWASLSPGGSDTYVQFNDSGAFGGSANLVFNKTTGVLSLLASLKFLADAGATTRTIAVTNQSSSNVNGNDLSIQGSTGNGSGRGGALSLVAGAGGTTGAGGAVNITSGDSTGGNAGAFSLTGGNVLGGNGNGGGAIFQAGYGEGSGIGGNVQLIAGQGGASGAGGAATITGGAGGYSTGGNAGRVELDGGNAAAGNTNGGDIILKPGNKHSAGTDGLIKLYTNRSASVFATLDVASIASTSKTFTFQNKTGTLAMTSDVGWSQTDVLFDHIVDAGNGTTVETDLYSDTIAASQLATNGEKLEAEYGGVFVSSATATRDIKLYFGGTAIFDTGALTLSLSSAWTMFATIIRVSATVIRYMISFTTEGAALAAYTAVGELTGLTLSNTNILKITGQASGVGAATNDIVAKLGSVAWVAVA